MLAGQALRDINVYIHVYSISQGMYIYMYANSALGYTVLHSCFHSPKHTFSVSKRITLTQNSIYFLSNVIGFITIENKIVQRGRLMTSNERLAVYANYISIPVKGSLYMYVMIKLLKMTDVS